MIVTRTFAPVNSMIVICGPGDVDVPKWGEGRDFQVVATGSCIFSIAYPEIDGPTNFILGPRESVQPSAVFVFDGLLNVRNNELRVETVDLRLIVKTTVPYNTVGINIWFSHPKWPETVTIGWYAPSATVLDLDVRRSRR